MATRIGSVLPGTIVQVTGTVIGPAGDDPESSNSVLLHVPGGPKSGQWAINENTPVTELSAPLHPDDLAGLKGASDKRKVKNGG